MSGLRISPIVEGHGEEAALPLLLRRISSEFLQIPVEILKPIRQHRHSLVSQGQVRPSELARALRLAELKLRIADSTATPLILVLIDGDADPGCVLGPALQHAAEECAGHLNISCVVACVEFETWFVAAAESLTRFLDFDTTVDPPRDPERTRSGKGWIERRFRGVRYSPTQDQPRFTAEIDLQLCRRRAPSFDKLCRELLRWGSQ